MAQPAKDTPDDVKSRIKDSYDAIAAKYNDWTEDHSTLRLEYLDQLLELLPTSKGSVSILELGCGAGVPVVKKLLTFPNFDITANDLSSKQIALGKERLGEDRVKWIEGDMLGLDFPDSSLDAVVGFYSIIHLPREEQVTLLAKISKWLKPGGYLLANFSTAAFKDSVNEKWLDEKGWMYWSGWGADGTLEKIKSVGLETVIKEIKHDGDSEFIWVIARK